MPEDNNLDASSFLTATLRYQYRFKELLISIYTCYETIIGDDVYVEKNENKIRDKLVDDYLIPTLLDYEFYKEEPNADGRVDIYIVDTLSNEKPHFILECKLLDKKSTKDSLSGKYISNGIYRYLTEHYFLDNNFYTNAMIGFIVEEIDEISIVSNINTLTIKILKNLVEIKQDISCKNKPLYESHYQTGKPEKDFIIYHLFMDFSKNLQG